MDKCHAINLLTRGNGAVPPTARHIYYVKWTAGIVRYLIINIYVTESMIFMTINETDHQSLKIYENNPQELKRCWASKRGMIRNFKRKEAWWTTPGLEEEWHADSYRSL